MINGFLSLFASMPACNYPAGNFLGFPYWYQYLPPSLNTAGQCVPSLTSLSDVWLIALAVMEILLRLAAIIAVVIVIFAGVQFMTSQGEPAKTNNARTTLINAVVGLLITISAAALVSFIAGQFK